MKASDPFVRNLVAEGVEFVSGIPGEENLDFLNSRLGVHVIEIPVDYSENDLVLNKQLREKTCVL